MEGEFVRKLASERYHRRGGGERYGRVRRYRYGAAILVRQQRPMNVGTGTHLLSRQFPPLGLVLLFIGGWRAEEQEAGRNGAQELIRVTP